MQQRSSRPQELFEAVALTARLRGISLDEAAQALAEHAALMQVPVVVVARAVLASSVEPRSVPS